MDFTAQAIALTASCWLGISAFATFVVLLILVGHYQPRIVGIWTAVAAVVAAAIVVALYRVFLRGITPTTTMGFTFTIYAALKEDINSGWVWTVLDPNVRQRSIVKITCPTTKKSVYCEALAIENNYLDDYNGRHTTLKIPLKKEKDRWDEEVRRYVPKYDRLNPISMNEWYRNKLGGERPLKTQVVCFFEMSVRNDWWGRFQATRQHAQVSVRLSAWLGLLGLGLGIVGVLLGVIAVIMGLT